MKYIWKIVTNFGKIGKLIDLIKKAFEDKKLTGAEAEQVLDDLIALLVEIGVIEKE